MTNEQAHWLALQECLGAYGGQQALDSAYGPGTLGHHEAAHTCHVLADTFEKFVAEHAAVIREKPLFFRALKIVDEMHELYQLLATGQLAQPLDEA